VTIHQHIPTFVEGAERQRAEFETREELERVPWVARWKEQSQPRLVVSTTWDSAGYPHQTRQVMPAGPQFERFSYSPAEGSQRSTDILMAELQDGSWWVVGFLEPRGAGERLGLPIWRAPE
jgi:hypothetical protein